MRNRVILICLIVFCSPSVSWAQKCFDYACNISRARTALNQKQFKEALAYCKAAKAYPNANVVEADALIDKVFEGIEAQKKIAENATILAKTEANNAKRAKEEAIAQADSANLARRQALQQADIARKEKLKAEEATKRAEKSTRAAENTATFMKVQNYDPTLGVRMMRYNYDHHPENKFTRDIYHKTVDKKTHFYTDLQIGFKAESRALAFSPDGTQVAVGSSDGHLFLWDVVNRNKEKVFLGYAGSVRALAFSPDGKKILAGSTEGLATLWDIETRKEEKIFNAGTSYIFSVAFSPDGKKILTGSTHGMTILWDVASGQPEKYFVQGITYISAVAFSPDGQKVLTGSYDKTVKLWDVATGKLDKSFVGHQGEVHTVTFSPDGKKILTSSIDKTARIWDVASGKEERVFKESIGNAFDKVAFTPDGKKIITGSIYYGSVKLWDIVTQVKEDLFEVYTMLNEALAFSSDGKKLVLVRSNNFLMLWEGLREDTEKAFVNDEAPIMSMAVSPDGKTLLTGSNDPIVKLWDSQNGQLLKKFVGHHAAVLSVAFSPPSTRGKKVLTCSRDDTARIWDMESGLTEQTFLWDSISAEAKRSHRRFFSVANPVAVFSPDGKTVLTSGGDKSAKLWNAENGQLLQTYVGLNNNVTSFAFSPDGKQIAMGALDDSLKLWDTESGRVLKTFKDLGGTLSVAFSPDGQRIATGDRDSRIKLWHVASGTLEKTFIGHGYQVKSVAFSPDGKKILAGSRDNIVKLWNVDKGIAEKTFIGHTNAVNAVAFSLNGKKIFTASEDGTVRQWDIEKDAVENKMYPFSLSEMASHGLIIEPEDTPQYLRDSMAERRQYDWLRKWDESPEKAATQKRFNEQRNATYTLPYKPVLDSLIKIAEANQRAEQAKQVADAETQRKQAALDKEKNDPVGFLKDKIQAEADTLKQYKLYGILIDSLTKRWRKAPLDYATELADAYNSHAYLGLFLNKYKNSEKDIRAGIAVESTNQLLYTNLAPALLLQGKFQEAQAEYEKWKDKAIELAGFETYKDAFLDDLNKFEEAGIIPKARAQDVTAIRILLARR